MIEGKEVNYDPKCYSTFGAKRAYPTDRLVLWRKDWNGSCSGWTSNYSLHSLKERLMIKTLKAMVIVEIRADADDEDAVKEAIKDAVQEQIELDKLDYTVEESEDEEDLG